MNRDNALELLKMAKTQSQALAVLSTLTINEQMIVEILMHQKHAISVGEIRNIFIYATYSYIIKTAHRAGIVTTTPHEYFPGLIKNPPRILGSTLTSIVTFFRKIPPKTPEYKRIKLLNKIFSRHGVKTLGDSTITNALDNLRREGLVQKRVTPSTSKTNAVYYLNPPVREGLSHISKKS